jgi:predicted nucleotidyltransferase component of viral defense system
MIPQADIVAWRRVAPWAEDSLVEQDLVLSRALVELFREPALAASLALRGGTALHRLILLPPSRYSEDIDLVQTHPGSIGPTLSVLRRLLDPWLGRPARDLAESSVTLVYRFTSEIPPIRRLRLKIEIHTREHFTLFGLVHQPLRVESRWFSGAADIATFPLDELLGTKLRALYQRRHGRDLFDLWDAASRAPVSPERIVTAFLACVEAQGLRISRAEFEQNLAAKERDRAFLTEVLPMLAPGIRYDASAAMIWVRREIVSRLPGAPWQGT